ncbi:MAG: amidase [Acetobacteraceae bacterium]|nr:amidase [Acetobacteraceae bacterium]
MSLHGLSAADLARLVRTGAASAREVAAAALARIEAVNPALNAIVECRPEETLLAADSVDRMRAAGQALGPLAGVPVTIKVNVDQAGHATTNGVVAFRDVIAAEDSPVVANLKAAGAVVVGRTNTPAFSYRYFTANDLHGTTFNPRNRALTPGGSSGGAAAAAATGMGAIHHGNDLGGSIRYPAYACGVGGIRPSFGRVPSFNATARDERPLALQLMSVQGPHARSIADLRLALSAMSAPDARDPWHAPAPLEMPIARPLRVAFATMGAEPPVAAALAQARGWLEDAGVIVEEATPPDWDEAIEKFLGILGTDAGRTMARAIDDNADEATRFAFHAYHSRVPGLDLAGYAQALARRTAIWRTWQRWLTEEFHALLMPVSRAVPFVQDLDRTPSGFDFVMHANEPLQIVNFLGLPGLSVPTATIAEGVPLGVQLVAARFREDICFCLAEILEARAGVTAAIDPAG